MFRFVNTAGRQVWIKPRTVQCIFENENHTFTVQCYQSIWTMYKVDCVRLLERLERLEAEEEVDDPDWWKKGRPNPLDSELDEEDE